MDRRHFLETLAAGLLTVSCTMPVRQSMPGPSPIPVERDEKGLTPLSRFFVTAIVSFPPKILLLADAISPKLGDLFVRLLENKRVGRLIGTYKGSVYHHQPAA